MAIEKLFFANRTLKWLLSLLCACACLIEARATYAQGTPPSPPASVVQSAVHAAAVMGVSLTSTPTYDPVGVGKYSGNPLWELRFYSSTEDATVSVDETLNKVVEFTDGSAVVEAGRAFRSGAYPGVNIATASATVLRVMHNLPVDSPNSWQITEQESSNHPGDNGNPGAPYYVIVARRMINGAPSTVDRFFAMVEPYNGKITDWSYEDGAVFPEHGPVISADAAQQAANNAYLTYMGNYIQSGDPQTPSAGSTEPMWSWMGGGTPLCQLTYSFHCSLPKIADPNPNDPSDTVFHGRGHMFLIFQIDAVTGDFVSGGNIIGGASLASGNLPPISQRTRMVGILAREHPLTPLALAVASSLPSSTATVPPVKASTIVGKVTTNKLFIVDSLTPAAPPSATVRFTRHIGQLDVPFALDVKANRLSWQVPPVASQDSANAKPAPATTATAGQWETVALPKTQTAALKAWLDKPTGASAKATTAAATKEGATAPAVAVSGKP